MSKILLVDDDTNLLEAIKYNLLGEGYTVFTAEDGISAVELARQEKPDLIILDIMIPRLDGFEVCRILRKEIPVPILMLTARTGEVDKVVGLELGADDYMTKPFSMIELLARIRAMLRRATPARTPAENPASEIVKVGNLRIDVPGRRVLRVGATVRPTPTEYGLLAFLSRNRGRAFSREYLLEKVWGNNSAVGARTINFHILSLRRKLEADPAHPVHLVTVRGIGYKLEG